MELSLAICSSFEIDPHSGSGSTYEPVQARVGWIVDLVGDDSVS